MNTRTTLFGMAVGALLLTVVAGCSSDRKNRQAGHYDKSVQAGCWVDVYAKDDFMGEPRHITGPNRLATLVFPNRNWDNSINSISVGPNAWVHVYKDKQFTGGDMWLMPNQRVSKLSVMNFSNDIESMEIFDHEPSAAKMQGAAVAQ